ncbi:MAG: o-succinylbenzoate--CoA ligase [Prevotella ruminicola]|uniref:O-succinylbenzoate--CoA ligase n=1 Tax=Xylanibacter ruminicola TaxID=839 RepID=A0A9D5S7T0_XYLRU|nr:o-succinylbenzoate--CoA ligase [Xylanibacter ruminicola]
MFLDLDKKDKTAVAVIDDSGQSITYGDICDFSKKFHEYLPIRALIFILSENRIGSLLGYTSALSNRIVPLILSAKTEKGLYENLRDMYKPEYLWLPNEMVEDMGYETIFSDFGYTLVKTGNPAAAMYEDLSLLLPTSGSTGSPKLVRHSYRNIEANAFNVLRMFGLTPSEKAMAILPMHYTMGLSVIASHLLAGATLLLSGRSLLDKGFWDMLKEATSFTGVPYSYEILMKMRFTRMDLPNLKIITQGGGKLTEEMFQALAKYAQEKGKQFIPTYGQSECTARMAYLPAELALTKTCSIGMAEPGGQLSIIDNDGNETFEGVAQGEMVYRGENVTLGYAYSIDDLQKGDENHGVMHTGDLAKRDADGCYYIVGRLKRFLKIFGLRIGLDEIEGLIKERYDIDCYCKGDDEKLIVLITKADLSDEIISFIEEKTHLFHKNIEVQIVDAILRNEAGKVINQ